MKRTRTPLVAANWKLNPITLKEAKELFVAIRKTAKKLSAAEVVIAPPFPFLGDLSRLSPSGALALGAQDVFYEEKGAFTGEVAPGMLVSSGVRYVIIGHSERRALGETDEVVNKKIHASLKAKLLPIVCLGESNRDYDGKFFDLVQSQVKAALAGVPVARLKHMTIAYEPIWAIGTGKTPTSQDVEEMQLFIRKIITELYDRTSAGKVRIIYGGSVKADNAEMLFTEGGVDGFLVGGASLKPKEFATIITSAQIGN